MNDRGDASLLIRFKMARGPSEELTSAVTKIILENVRIWLPQLGMANLDTDQLFKKKRQDILKNGVSEELANQLALIAVMDLASEKLSCATLVIILAKACPTLRELLHSLMYAGGSIVTKPPFDVHPNLVLVGFEL